MTSGAKRRISNVRLLEIGATVALVLTVAAIAGVWLQKWRQEQALMGAAYAGDTERLRAVVARGVDVNTRDGFGTALMAAAGRYHTSAVELLLAGGADVNAVSPDGLTALSLAIGQAPLRPTEALPVVGALVAHGADVDRRRSNGLTARQWAERWQRTLDRDPKGYVKSMAAVQQPLAAATGGTPPTPAEAEAALRAIIHEILRRPRAAVATHNEDAR